MIKHLFLILIIFVSLQSLSQTLRITGNTNDTAGKQTLPNALLMAVKFTDSSLVNFTRSNKEGIFKPIILPLDTYIVIISHPNFNDRTYLLVPNKNDTAFKFKNVVLPPKSVQLNEVEIIAYKDKMYYKGDTLQFTADSFKTRPNATVEDLLRKLPGVKVDAAGKITIQGKTVDQVLVDGDEFFGSDPTIATKNLNANTVETIQVYEKKNENTEAGGDETLKVVNLKLKDEAKRGYFGKISAASDGQKFYENDLLVNKFKNNRKVSLFGLLANTPKQAFGWQDANKYGLSNEYNNNYDPETNTWTSYNSSTTGVPQTLKTGFYFNDKFGKNTKINTDYTYKRDQLVSGSETNTQFFLTDTTYSNKQQVAYTSQNQTHNFNFKLVQKIDSLTELTIKPKLNYVNNESSNYQNDEFISKEGELQRQTTITNKGKSETIDASVQMFLRRNFMKKDRMLTINYQPSYYNSTSNNNLNTDFKYFKNQLPDSALLQKKSALNHKEEHNATITYIEPLSKKFKTELSYAFNQNNNNNSRKTLDYNGIGYDIVNTTQSNDFKNTRIINRVGTKLIYDVKKYRFSVGVNVRNVFQENINITKDQKLNQTITNILPLASANFRINQSSNFTIFYTSSAQQADLQKMQPVVDNSDPNRIIVGNPNLKTQFTNNFQLNYYTYKGISDVNFYSGASANAVANEFNDKTSFDALGKSISTPINVNGNYNANLWMGGGFPVFKRFFKVNPNLSGSFNNSIGFVNEQKNITQTMSFNPGLTLDKQVDFLYISIGGDYQYNVTKQTISISSNQPYYTYSLNGNINLKLPKKFRINADGVYTNNGNRTNGYNINYFVLNASLSKSFFKTESLTLSAEANDILNQNISNQRYITANKITDTKTQIIKQYFLLRLLYKFTSQKAKEEEGEYFD
jgi:hypothetical protein